MIYPNSTNIFQLFHLHIMNKYDKMIIGGFASINKPGKV